MSKSVGFSLSKPFQKNGTVAPNFTNHISVDWLRFSVPAKHWFLVAGLFDLADVEWVERQRYRRKYFAYVCEGVIVASDFFPALDGLSLEGARDDDRFIVDFSGNGLGMWFSQNGWTSVRDLLFFFLELEGVRVNRMDIAFDDFCGYLKLRRIYKLLRQGRSVSTRWLSVDFHESGKIRDMGEDSGVTVYVGRRSSDAFLRFYDKLALELSRGGSPTDLPTSWKRCELELKGLTAHAVALEAVRNWHPQFFTGYLRSKIDFKVVRSDDSKLSRRPPARWWKCFLGGTEVRRVAVPAPVLSIERVERWVGKSVAPSLALLMEHHGGDVDWLYAMIRCGVERLTPEKRVLLHAESLHTHGL